MQFCKKLNFPKAVLSISWYVATCRWSAHYFLIFVAAPETKVLFHVAIHKYTFRDKHKTIIYTAISILSVAVKICHQQSFFLVFRIVAYRSSILDKCVSLLRYNLNFCWFSRLLGQISESPLCRITMFLFCINLFMFLTH